MPDPESGSPAWREFLAALAFQDIANFFARLPNPDRQFIATPGIAHSSLRSKNRARVLHILDAYFSQPAPVYVG